MKILVTGGNGQLGSSLQKISRNYPGLDCTFTDIDELNLTDHNEVAKFLHGKGYDWLINCAAYTSVDQAEDEPEKARSINVTAVEHLAKLAHKNRISLVHVSTDYVFDGKHDRPYTESDIPNPINTYGLTKYESEKAAADHCKHVIILRTSWLYSEYGNNFLHTILKLSEVRRQIKVVSDQVSTPTYAGDLAEIILKIVSGNKPLLIPEIYHYSNEGVASWYDFAEEIISLSGKDCEIVPITTEEYPLRASRPSYSVLSKDKITNDLGLSIPHWRESLKKCIGNLQQGTNSNHHEKKP
jgi:dTDP-4-dehydrorhamnose reductase